MYSISWYGRRPLYYNYYNELQHHYAVMLFLELLCGRYPVISGHVFIYRMVHFIINIKHCYFAFIQDIRRCDVIYMT